MRVEPPAALSRFAGGLSASAGFPSIIGVRRLVAASGAPHLFPMDIVRWWKALGRNEHVRIGLFALGCVLVALAPVVGLLPGPGGILVFALGLGLMLRNSLWAKKRYVAFKRRWPKHGAWADWGLRRKSARRRDKIAKARAKLRAANGPSAADMD
ncbi:hypothetical protein [Sphingomonas fennica]|nr:hypothetical protein [Sphingomonas fennica]